MNLNLVKGPTCKTTLLPKFFLRIESRQTLWGWGEWIHEIWIYWKLILNSHAASLLASKIMDLLASQEFSQRIFLSEKWLLCIKYIC